MKSINSKEEFMEHLSSLISELEHNPEKWENKSLPEYLEALKAWVNDMDGYYKNINYNTPQNVNWGIFADMLTAAKIYE